MAELQNPLLWLAVRRQGVVERRLGSSLLLTHFSAAPKGRAPRAMLIYHSKLRFLGAPRLALR
ncbi:hypothetical protein OH686_09645 [Pseudomonas sp. SO81]|nr:hypothetical protein OH686_09645 [Pseudomonas sp. SO81]